MLPKTWKRNEDRLVEISGLWKVTVVFPEVSAYLIYPRFEIEGSKTGNKKGHRQKKTLQKPSVFSQRNKMGHLVI